MVLIGTRKPLNAKMTVSAKTELPAFVLPRISRLTGHYQSGDDELKTLMRVMRAYSNIKVTFALFLADNLETLFAAVFGVNMSLS